MTNVQTVQEIYAVPGRGDVPFILDQLAEDVAWEQWENHSAQKAGVDHLLARHGKAGAAEFFGAIAPFEIADFRAGASRRRQPGRRRDPHRRHPAERRSAP